MIRALAALSLVASGVACAPVTLVAIGDVALGPRATSDPLAPIAALLDGDVRIANLESPLAGTESGTPQELRLAAPPERARVLAGRIDVASLANNHALDQGAAGRDATATALARAGVSVAWAGRDARVARRGIVVRVIARHFAPTADLDNAGADIVAAVAAARRSGELVVASLHWGHTGSLLPTPAQRRLAARLVDAGASVVAGHGPHTPQGIERRGRAVIAYSLGNVAFDCRCTDASDAYALRVTVRRDGAVVDARARPFTAGLAAAPASPDADAGLYDLLTTLSRDLGTRLVREGEWLVVL